MSGYGDDDDDDAVMECDSCGYEGEAYDFAHSGPDAKCPACGAVQGESGGAGPSPLLECPQCEAEIAYDDVQEAELEDHARCPECGCASPTEQWFG